MVLNDITDCFTTKKALGFIFNFSSRGFLCHKSGIKNLRSKVSRYK